MTTIADAVASLELDNAGFSTALVRAVAEGTQFSEVASQTRAAQAQAASAIARAKVEEAEANAAAARITAALSARTRSLDAVAAARGAGEPLSNAKATALETSVRDANGGDAAKLTAALGKVTTLDDEIAILGDTETQTLAAAIVELDGKKTILAEKKLAALVLIAAIEGNGAALDAGLKAALDARDTALALSAATGDAPHRAAIVAYVDYAARRTELSGAKTNAALVTDWEAARDAWLTAAGDVAAAEEAVIEARLAFALKKAEKSARLVTRSTDAAAKAAEAY